MQPFIAMIVPMGAAPGSPDNTLPEKPGFPSTGPGFPTNPIAPGGQPPGTWGGAGQPFPGYGLPGGDGKPPTMWPGTPGHDLPELPPSTWPPSGDRPGNPIVLPPNTIGGGPIYPEVPGHPLPQPPGTVWPPIQGGSGKAIALVAISGVGYRWTVIDLGASIGHPLPPGGDKPPVAPGTPGHPLPPTAQPKR